MYPSIDKIKAFLVKEDYISAEDSAAAEQTARDSAGYIDYLIRQDLLSKNLLGQALAEGYKLPFADLSAKPPTKEQVTLIAEDAARAMRIVVIRSGSGAVAVATD